MIGQHPLINRDRVAHDTPQRLSAGEGPRLSSGVDKMEGNDVDLSLPKSPGHAKPGFRFRQQHQKPTPAGSGNLARVRAIVQCRLVDDVDLGRGDLAGCLLLGFPGAFHHLGHLADVSPQETQLHLHRIGFDLVHRRKGCRVARTDAFGLLIDDVSRQARTTSVADYQ